MRYSNNKRFDCYAFLRYHEASPGLISHISYQDSMVVQTRRHHHLKYYARKSELCYPKGRDAPPWWHFEWTRVVEPRQEHLVLLERFRHLGINNYLAPRFPVLLPSDLKLMVLSFLGDVNGTVMIS